MYGDQSDSARPGAQVAEWEGLRTAITGCRHCPRLVAWREEVARTRRRAHQDEEYWGRPLPGFGDHEARVLVVGLAPAAHGGNRTGRIFTGDSSGDFLYAALYRAGFANQPISVSRDDGLALHDVFISAVCRCVPPDNKPAPGEISNCLPYLAREMALLRHVQIVVALGRIAFDGILRLPQMQKPGPPDPRIVGARKPGFSHGAIYHLGDGLPTLVAAYHPSRRNTQTGLLTPQMYDDIWTSVRSLLAG